jgi:predicted acetyltransferase
MATTPRPDRVPPTGVAIIAPTAVLQVSWLATRNEFAGMTMHGSGTWERDVADLADPEQFADWVDHLRRQDDPQTPLPQGRVHATYRWLVEDGQYAGCYSLRHRLNDYLLTEGGHLGYSVRPAARRRGHASAMTQDALALAASLGLDRILVTTDADNLGSQAVIRRAGGRYEDTREGKLRYWITVPR